MERDQRKSNRLGPIMLGWLAAGIVVLAILAADALLPRIIANAYAGQGPARLVGFFEQRRQRHGLEHYLNLWRDFRTACLIATGAFGVVVAAIGRACAESGRKRLSIVMMTYAAAFLGMTVLWGPRQDYVAHLRIWDEVSAGRDPWWFQPESGIVLNAYGPLFEALAPLARFNPLGPKIVFASSYLLYAVALIRLTDRSPASSNRTMWLLMLWLANPFFWLEIAFYGHFDVLVGLLAVGGLMAFGKGAKGRAGVLIGLGFLLKFVPAVLVPFLAIRRRAAGGYRVDGRFLAGSLGVMFAGMAAAWGIWGGSVFRPLAFVSSRGSSLLSVWRYLKGPYSPEAWLFGASTDLDRFATPVLLAALGVVWVIVIRKRSESMHACLCAMIVTLVFYRVGFVQYQMIPFLMLPLWVMRHRRAIEASRGTRFALMAWVVWITGFDLFDNAVGGIVGFDRPWAWFEDWVGLPHFVLGMWLLLALLRLPVRRMDDEPERAPLAADQPPASTLSQP